ncbi:alpha/beta hydrolase [Rhodobacteraceae bacterium WD3A24]|nr:alpha/beta hydrolase [Rhodobacteraceae bacterium WD3A24]
MIHCSLAHSGAWRGVADRLSDRLRMTAFDLPMHGRGPDWDGRSDLHDLATAMARETAAAEGAPVELIGHSFGATVALRLALESPALVRSLTMVEPVLFAAARSFAPEVHAAYMEAVEPVEAAWLEGDRAEAARRFIGMWGAGAPWAELPEAQRAYMVDRIGFIPATAHSLADDAHGLLAPGRLEGLTRPVLIVRGAASPPIMEAVTAALAARLPDARMVEVPGAGHMLPLTHPDAVARAIAERIAP